MCFSWFRKASTVPTVRFLAKAILTGKPNMYKIMLKFTKTEEKNKTRIDLVNATDIIWARGDVDKDIQQLAEKIGQNR